MKGRTLILSAAAFVIASCPLAQAQSATCSALLHTSERIVAGRTQITVRNDSASPVLAYVIADQPAAANDPKFYSLHGVYTEGDSLLPKKAIEAGTLPRRASASTLFVDYVRLADGTTCGPVSTTDAKEIAARFK